jgi:hypothetical protein
MKKIVAVIVVFAIIGLGVVWQKHRDRARALSSGEAYVRDQPTTTPQPLPSPAAPQSSSGDEIATTATPQPAAPAGSGVQENQGSRAANSTPANVLPGGDTIPRNPPNGLAFAGSGKFQLYRQGDITWRLNTQTGDACILFATDMQWRHARVYQSGCGTRGETTVATGD